MIDGVDQMLKEWVDATVDDVDVAFEPPGADVERATVHLYLLELVNAVPTRRDHPRSLEVALRYLVTISAPAAGAAHAALGQLVFAALERGDFQVELRPLAPEFWTAFGVAPRPAFLLQVPLVMERPLRVPRVRTPAEVHVSAASGFGGVVLTPDDVPVVRARVELPGLDAVTYTDQDGRFQFGAVPTQSRARAVRIVAKGTELLVSKRLRADEPLVIRFELKET